ncbi:MAG: SMP-30/gluconolactonase/LRE family protein [Bryobacteraceae bacterium]|nr:SMP-30/gluconolactonase/LRE family protein [Bryobacteraceae bacterium]
MRFLLTFTLLLPLPAADFDAKDPSVLAKLFPKGAALRRLATDMQFIEGPVWMPAGFLVFSDIPANELKRWDGQSVASFRTPSQHTNGNTLDRQGRLISAEHDGRLSRTEADGQVVTLVDSFEGKKLNSPNDAVVKRDGSIWFTDPDYGLGTRAKEQPGNYVYRFDPAKRAITAVVKDFDKPNGLCFSPDERRLYVADSGKPRHIRVFDVQLDGTLANGRVFATIDKGGPDGIRADEAGRIWSSSGDGAQVFSPDGQLLVRILLPEAAANLTFGGKDGRTLFLTARKSLYAVETRTRAPKR